MKTFCGMTLGFWQCVLEILWRLSRDLIGIVWGFGLDVLWSNKSKNHIIYQDSIRMLLALCLSGIRIVLGWVSCQDCVSKHGLWSTMPGFPFIQAYSGGIWTWMEFRHWCCWSDVVGFWFSSCCSGWGLTPLSCVVTYCTQESGWAIKQKDPSNKWMSNCLTIWNQKNLKFIIHRLHNLQCYMTS